MSGSEIQAQLLENLLEGTLLQRPRWAPALEAAVLLVLGGLLLWATPRWRPHHAVLLLLGCVAVPLLLALAAFHWDQMLFDAMTPGLSLLLFFSVLLVLTLADATQQGRALRKLVRAQRLEGARLSGELQAAQRVQTATLPRAETLRADPRLELDAALQPAREVGGDLYDFFMLDERRLFLLIGDVAGKGLSASIFMAVSKALYKSAMLRTPDADIGAIMVVANGEVSRDNPGNLFVTTFAAILDLDSGELRYCNAGHDNPYRLHESYEAPRRIDDGDGPPLCAIPDYDYRGAGCRLLPGELLCLITDGVTEAQTADGRLYGTERLQQRLLELQRRHAGARELVESLQTDVAAFAAGAEAADDLTILALRWNGPRGGTT
jgi:adenylate cyclase